MKYIEEFPLLFLQCNANQFVCSLVSSRLSVAEAAVVGKYSLSVERRGSSLITLKLKLMAEEVEWEQREIYIYWRWYNTEMDMQIIHTWSGDKTFVAAVAVSSDKDEHRMRSAVIRPHLFCFCTFVGYFTKYIWLNIYLFLYNSPFSVDNFWCALIILRQQIEEDAARSHMAKKAKRVC